MALGKIPASGTLLNSGSAICNDLLAGNSLYRLLHDHGDELFGDDMFADLYERGGRASISPRVLATVLVLQKFEGASDREAVERFSYDVRWKYACGGLDSDFRPFVHSVLVQFRARLRHSKRPDRIFTSVLDVAQAAGLIGRRRVLDSTALYDAVATQDTVTLIRMAIRELLRVCDGLALGRLVDAGATIRAVLTRDDDYRTRGKPECDWDDEATRLALIDALSRDGLAALAALEGVALTEEVAAAVDLLARILAQDIEQGPDGTYRIMVGVAPDRVISTVDPEARHGRKSSSKKHDGYKGHVAVDPDSEMITNALVTAANEGDGAVTAELIADLIDEAQATAGATEDLSTPTAQRVSGPAMTEPAEGGAPSESPTVEPAPAQGDSRERPEVYGDAAYGTADVHAILQDHGIDAYTKTQAPHGRDGRFGQDAFTVDTGAGTVTCPANQTVRLHGNPTGERRAAFGNRCATCPLKDQCTASAKGRTVSVHPQHDLLAEVRKTQSQDEWQKKYRATRPKVERKQAHMMRRRHGGRRARVRGRRRVEQDFLHLAAAINLSRLKTLGLRREDGKWTTAAL